MRGWGRVNGCGRGHPRSVRPHDGPAGLLTYRGAVPVRRRPRFLPFILTGAVVGFVVGAFLASRPDEVANRTIGTYSPSSAIGYLGFGCAAIGALLAAVLAIVLERRLDRD